MTDSTNRPGSEQAPSSPNPQRNHQGPPSLGAAVAIGVGVGTSFGVAMDNVALGAGMGAALGVAIGLGFGGVGPRRRRNPDNSRKD